MIRFSGGSLQNQLFIAEMNDSLVLSEQLGNDLAALRDTDVPKQRTDSLIVIDRHLVCT